MQIAGAVVPVWIVFAFTPTAAVAEGPMTTRASVTAPPPTKHTPTKGTQQLHHQDVDGAREVEEPQRVGEGTSEGIGGRWRGGRVCTVN